MSRRVKLITEWVEWQYAEDAWRLTGAKDFVAIVHTGTNGTNAYVYTEVRAGVYGPSYGRGKRVAFGVGTEEGIQACETALLDTGLMDPIHLLAATWNEQ